MKKKGFVFTMLGVLALTILSGCDFLFDDSSEGSASQSQSQDVVKKVKVLKAESSFYGDPYEDVVDELEGWGFINVEAKPSYDIIWGITKPGSTKSVSIDGSTSFWKNDTFDNDVPVIVTYSMPYNDDPARKEYEITWQYDDGRLIKKESLLVGTMPKYVGTTPSKAAFEDKKYVFSGWTPELAIVTEATTYTALFSVEINTFVITWKNEKGEVLEIDNAVNYGDIPTYDSALPTKAGDEINTYVFDKWSPEIYSANKDQVYTAQFTAVPIEFTKETAKKVVQVVLTNYMAPDNLDDAGNYVDRTRFHPYSYSGPYKLTLVSEGTWKYLGENTWQVSNMRFRSWVHPDTYYPVYAKVSFDGEFYLVTEADNGMASNPSRHIVYEFTYAFRVLQEWIDN